MKHKEGHILINGDKRFIDIQVKTLELIAETGGEFKRLAIDEPNIKSITQKIPTNETPAAEIYVKKGKMSRYVVSSTYGCGKITLKYEGSVIIHEAQHGEDYRKKRHIFKQGIEATERSAYEKENEWRKLQGLQTHDVDAVVKWLAMNEERKAPLPFKEMVHETFYELMTKIGEKFIRIIPAPADNEVYSTLRNIYGTKRE